MGESTLVFQPCATAIDNLLFPETEHDIAQTNNRAAAPPAPLPSGAPGRQTILQLMRARGLDMQEIDPEIELEDVAQIHIKEQSLSQAFFIVNLGRLYDQYARWSREVPSVTPFYAVKCNPDPNIVSALSNLGCNFDCASVAEMRLVVKLGIAASRIVFANPCKKAHHIEWARDHGVNRMTFDNKPELDKVKQLFPDAELILRIAADDSSSACRFRNKFGLEPECAEEVLLHAQRLDLKVVGVSFHVGSNCTDPRAYRLAIADCKHVFDVAERLGFPKLQVVDIGGGFAGEPNSPLFDLMAAEIREALDDYFPTDGYGKGVEVIAEPGRFFAASTHTLVTHIFAKREPARSPNPRRTYYVDDGVYGSFNSILYDHASPTAEALRVSSRNAISDTKHKTVVFGPTCDGLDNLTPSGDVLLPELELGDFLLWRNMGAYTCAASGYNFNGMEAPLKFYVYQ